jgi:hypothetical protein
MLCRVGLVWTDVSEERVASIFRVEKPASEEPALAGGCRLSEMRQRSVPRYLYEFRPNNAKELCKYLEGILI